jgi:hypothetical protein
MSPQQNEIEEEPEKEGEIERIPDLDELDVEIQGDFQRRGVQFGTVLGSNPEGPRYVNDTSGLPNQSKEEVFKQFKKEAGAIRDNKSTARNKE